MLNIATFVVFCTCMLCSFFVVDRVRKITRNYDKFSLRCRTNACSSNSIHSAHLFVAEYKKTMHIYYTTNMATPTGGLRGGVFQKLRNSGILCTYLGQLLCHNYFFFISFEPYECIYIVTWEKFWQWIQMFFIFHHPFTLTFINQ